MSEIIKTGKRIKNCPFCNGKAVLGKATVYGVYDTYYVMCSQCKIQTRHEVVGAVTLKYKDDRFSSSVPTKKHAIRIVIGLWNNRPIIKYPKKAKVTKKKI